MSRPYRRRPGFTLIEMMVVIVIIGILVALLVPVVIGAVRTARNAQVSAEIVNMAQALNAFKDKYGDFPPSRIILSESLAFSQYNTLDPSNSTALSSVSNWYGTTPPNITANDITLGELAQRSARFLRKFFPQAQPPAPTAQVPYWYDFNGNASTNGSSGPDPGLIYLQGDECLVFFLGGIPNPEGISAARTGFGTSGFGKSPQFPFSCPGVTTTSNNRLFSSNRNNPFYEFQSSRLYDPDGDGIPGYIDTLNPNPGGDARFFAYFSAYGNNNYDPNDVNNPNPAAIEQDNTGGPLVQAFRVGYVVTGGTNTVSSPAPNPYTSGLPVPTSTTQPVSFINPNTFQIISAGADGLYGWGGQYIANSTGDKLPANANGGQQRDREQDNLSNFATSRLD